MDWTIEARASAGGTTVTIASHDATPALTRRHRATKAVIALFPELSPRTSLGCFAGTAMSAFRPIGRLLIIPPGSELEVRTSGEERRRMVWCHIDSDRIQASELSWPRDREALANLLDLRSSALAWLVRELAREAETPGIASSTRIEGLSLLVLVELARLLDRSKPRPGGGLAPWQLRRVQEMLADLGNTPSIPQLAHACGLGKRHLMRAFQQSAGVTVGEYLKAAKVDAAKNLLNDPDIPIKEVAGRLGFTSPAAFSTFLKKALGHSPRKYRQRRVGTSHGTEPEMAFSCPLRTGRQITSHGSKPAGALR